MQSLSLFLLFVACASAIVVVGGDKSERRHAAPKVADNVPEDVLLFLEGVGVGLEISFAKNLNVCVSDETQVLDAFRGAYSDIVKGVEDFSVHEVEKGINLLGAGVVELRQVFLDCGVNATLADFDHDIIVLQGGIWGVVEFIASEVLNIVEHRISLGTYIRLAAKACEKDQQWKVCGYETGRFLAVLIKDYPLNGGDDDDDE